MPDSERMQLIEVLSKHKVTINFRKDYIHVAYFINNRFVLDKFKLKDDNIQFILEALATKLCLDSKTKASET